MDWLCLGDQPSLVLEKEIIVSPLPPSASNDEKKPTNADRRHTGIEVRQ